MEGVRRAITPRTRAIVVVHPNNPTGHFTKAWEAAELAEICRELNLSLIVDEVFLDYGIGEAARALPRGSRACRFLWSAGSARLPACRR